MHDSQKSCIAENRTVLCGLTHVMILSYISGHCEDVFGLQDDITHSEVQDFLMCSAGRILLLVINNWSCIIKLVTVLSHDDAIWFNATQNHRQYNPRRAPGTTLSMSEFTKHVICNTISQVTSNPVPLRRLGTGKVAQSRCARFRMRSYGVRSKFTNRLCNFRLVPRLGSLGTKVLYNKVTP